MSLELISFSALPPEQKPREKMMEHGIDYLNDVELLSVILGTGYKDMNVKQLSSHLLSGFGTKGLLQFHRIEDIQGQTGLPFVKSCQILAMAEYFRRVSRKDSTQIKSAEQLYEYVKDFMKKVLFEQLSIVCVDYQRRVLYSGLIAQGKTNALQVSLAAIFHHPIRLNASNFYLAHSHPNGICDPSPEDKKFTLQIKEEALKHGLSFDDHIIVGEDGFYSFALEGVL